MVCTVFRIIANYGNAVVVATLVGLGKKVHHAIDVVRKSRPGTIRNPMQIMYVKRFKSAWRAYKKKQARINMGLPVVRDTSIALHWHRLINFY